MTIFDMEEESASYGKPKLTTSTSGTSGGTNSAASCSSANGIRVNTKKLKILCIHGYRQSGESFREKTGALRKILKNHAEFAFVTAPNEVPPQNGEVAGQHGWWFSNADNSFDSKKRSPICLGFTKSLTVINAFVKENGPFDGLLGFSQGATFVSVLCGMQQKKMLDFKFSFAIMVAGFKSRCLPHDIYVDEIVEIPTLHVFGKKDQIISKELSEEMSRLFDQPVFLEHPGGHFVPAADVQKQPYINFLETVQRYAQEQNGEVTQDPS